MFKKQKLVAIFKIKVTKGKSKIDNRVNFNFVALGAVN